MASRFKSGDLVRVRMEGTTPGHVDPAGTPVFGDPKLGSFEADEHVMVVDVGYMLGDFPDKDGKFMPIIYVLWKERVVWLYDNEVDLVRRGVQPDA